MKKKGDFILGEFNVKLIIGVLCIIVLIMIGVYLSKLFTENNRKQQAESTLKEIVSEINLMIKTNDMETDYSLRSPQGWYFKSTFKANENKNYLCICPSKSNEPCPEGVCLEVQKAVNIDSAMTEIAEDRAEKLTIKIVNNEIVLEK